MRSAGGLRGEWTSLERLERWPQSLGFRHFWIKNDIAPVGIDGEEPDPGPSLK